MPQHDAQRQGPEQAQGPQASPAPLSTSRGGASGTLQRWLQQLGILSGYQRQRDAVRPAPATSNPAGPSSPAHDGPQSRAPAPAAPTPPVPKAEIAAVDGGESAAYLIDWDRDYRSIKAADTGTQPTSEKEAYLAHRTERLAAEFGPGTTLGQVLARIRDLDTSGDTKTADAMRAQLYRANAYAVVATLNVEKSGRYQPRNGQTYCNVYAYDMVRALGAYLPRVWWYSGAEQQLRAGKHVGSDYGKTVYEMNADGLWQWLEGTGQEFGWAKLDDMPAAQSYANAGRVVVLAAKNSRGPGHISVVLPETEQAQASGEGAAMRPLQSQAGAANENVGTGESRWWERSGYTGGAYVYLGGVDSPIARPEELGLDRSF